jgi:hypothetical protein
VKTSLDYVRDTEIMLRRENAKLAAENEHLRRENGRLLGELCSALDHCAHRNLMLALNGALPEQQSLSSDSPKEE